MPFVDEAQRRPAKEGITVKKRYFSEECVFAHIWNDADPDGLWDGDACTIADHFRVSEEEAQAALSALCDRDFIQRVGRRDYVITRWPDREKLAGEEAK